MAHTAFPLLCSLRRGLCALLVGSFASIAGAQALAGLPSVAHPAADPYTAGASEALDKAGYQSFGPFAFGNHHSTDDVRRLLPDEQLRWVETKHFRIGCALPPAPVAGAKAWQDRLRVDLQRLAQRVPGVDPKTKVLDAWLRVHLVAQRAEDVYAEVLTMLARKADGFPMAPGHEPRAGSEFLGLGPFLGMGDKFTILLVQKGASLAKYTAAYHGWATTEPTRRQDVEFGNLCFAAAGDTNHDLDDDEEALATLLTYHTAQNLYTGYRSFGHLLPAWLPHGLALWHARQVSTRIPLVAVRDDAERQVYRQWDKRLQGMRKDWKFEPLKTFVERIDQEKFTTEQHMQCFAFVDWLVRDRRYAIARFVDVLKDPFHDRMRFPTNGELFARQQNAFEAAFGVTVGQLEDEWRRQSSMRVAKR